MKPHGWIKKSLVWCCTLKVEKMAYQLQPVVSQVFWESPLNYPKMQNRNHWKCLWGLEEIELKRNLSGSDFPGVLICFHQIFSGYFLWLFFFFFFFVLQINSAFTFTSLYGCACNYSASCFNAVFLSVKWSIIIWVQLAFNIGAVKQVSNYFANVPNV